MLLASYPSCVSSHNSSYASLAPPLKQGLDLLVTLVAPVLELHMQFSLFGRATGRLFMTMGEFQTNGNCPRHHENNQENNAKLVQVISLLLSFYSGDQ